MKNKIFKIVLPFVSAILVATPVLADNPVGQFGAGDIYWAKNVTQGSKFVDPVSATCGNKVQFRARLHNAGPEALNNVKVVATPISTAKASSFSSQITITADNTSDGADVVTDTAGVNLDQAANLNYVVGSAELLDANGSKLQGLSDSLFTSGVNIGTVGVSTEQKRFVQFSAEVVCEPTPPVPPQDCTNPDYAAAHPDECNPKPKDCSDPDYAAAHPDECNPKPKDCSDPDYAAAHPDECNPTPPTPPTPVDPVDPPVSPVVPTELPKTGADVPAPQSAKGSTYTPTELPKTGGEVAGLIGMGGLTTSLGYYISSKRRLNRS